MPNSTLYWTNVPALIHSLSWVTEKLSLTLRELGTAIRGFGARNDNTSFHLNFARSGLKTAGFLYQRPALHH